MHPLSNVLLEYRIERLPFVDGDCVRGASKCGNYSLDKLFWRLFREPKLEANIAGKFTKTLRHLVVILACRLLERIDAGLKLFHIRHKNRIGKSCHVCSFIP